MVAAIEQAGGARRSLEEVPPSPHGREHVVIAGAGAAGAEAALTLQRIAGGRVATTIVTPEQPFVHFPPPVRAPFASGDPQAVTLAELAWRAGATLYCGSVVAVDSESRSVTCADGQTLAYDALLIAVGAVQRAPFARALTFGTPGCVERMHGLIRDVEDGYLKRVAFVVPGGAAWPVPVYELALLTAERAFDMCVDVELTLLTPEASPLELFGPRVSRAVARLLSAAGVDVRPRAHTATAQCLIGTDRVVTVPTLHGPAIEGLPHAAYGFLPVDAHGRVLGVDDVYAAGDATDFAVKQGGIACQQADAAAEAIAAHAGVEIDPAPFEPVLSALLLTDYQLVRMQREEGRVGDPVGQRVRSKFAGRELSRLLDASQAIWR